MKRSISLFLGMSLALSVVVPNAWALDLNDPILGAYAKTWIQRNPKATSQGFFEKGPYRKTLTAFTKQLSAYAAGKDPAELRKFYRGLEDKLGTMSKNLAAKCGSDTGKMTTDFARLFDAKKTGACSNAVLASLLGEIVVRQQSELDKVPKIAEGFEEKLGYLTLVFPTGAKATLKEVSDNPSSGFHCGEWGKDQCFKMAGPFSISTHNKTGVYKDNAEKNGKTYNCQITRPFNASVQLGFGEKIGGRETLTYNPTEDNGSKNNAIRTEIRRQPIEISGNLNREQALKRWNAVSLGKRTYKESVIDDRDGFDAETREWIDKNRKYLFDDAMVFELVRFNDFSSMTGIGEDGDANGKLNLGILHCGIDIPYIGEI